MRAAFPMADDPRSWLQHPEGWDALNQNAPTAEEAQQTTRGLLAEFETAKLFYEVMAAGRGPELLEHLEDVLFRNPIYSTNAIAFADLQIPLSADQWCWMRTGQNSVLHHIRAMLVKAVNGPPQVEQETKNGEQEAG